jgi:hypothetical protein
MVLLDVIRGMTVMLMQWGDHSVSSRIYSNYRNTNDSYFMKYGALVAMDCPSKQIFYDVFRE